MLFTFHAVSPFVMVACGVMLFIVGLLGGFAGGTLVGYCQWGRTHQKKPHPPTAEAPLYEEIDLTQQARSRDRN